MLSLAALASKGYDRASPPHLPEESAMPATVHKIGEPENASETKAIRHLAAELPSDYYVFHNFELTTERGLPYEYDLAVVAPHAVYHVEVKGYRGEIRGNPHQWIFENGGVMPSPIPLANKKTKILAGRMRAHSRLLQEAFVETVVLLTDDNARPRIKDDQSARVIRLEQSLEHLTDPRLLPVSTGNLIPFHNHICEALFATRPGKKTDRIGLYDVIERIGQSEERTVFLAKHRYIRTRPQTVLKVFHFDIYASAEEKTRQIDAIFHDQNALRLLGVHPNLIDTGDMFAWEDNKFVLPTEYVDGGRPLDVFLEEDRDASLTFAAKADIVSKIAKGLRHAHKAGVVHRDIRPRNVVVAPEGVVKLVNFDLALIRGCPGIGDPKGLARRLDRHYVAPEVFLDPAKASERSDVYSLGMVFYELLAGKRAYEDIQDVLMREKVPLDLALLEAELSRKSSKGFMKAPKDVAAVIGRMCRLDPKERYPGMDEVIEDLAIIG